MLLEAVFPPRVQRLHYTQNLLKLFAGHYFGWGQHARHAMPYWFLNTHMINIGTLERELLLTLSVRAK